MPFVHTGDIRLHYAEFGSGSDNIVFVHGNLGCHDWMNLVWPILSDRFHIYAFDWRGCGESDKPEPHDDYANYSMRQHATDMINAIKALNLDKSHLLNHSTGGIICMHMLLMAPERFKKVLCLDPVGPQGMVLPEESQDIFKSMKESTKMAFSVLAGTAPTLFDPESLKSGHMPTFSKQASDPQRNLFNTIVEKTRKLSDGIWFGTPIQLAKEFESGELIDKLKQITHPHLVLWGESDAWIPRDHVEEMVKLLPNGVLKIIPDAGHSLNLENPEAFAEIVKEFFQA